MRPNSRTRPLLAAGKNLGVTHLTNGAFRLHPVEWNIGEAAAVIESLTLAKGGAPKTFEVQKELAMAGVPLVWFDDLPVTHDAFTAVHFAAIRGVYPMNDHDLHAAPAPVERTTGAGGCADDRGGAGLDGRGSP